MSFKIFLNLIRFNNYIKNFLIFLPLFVTYSSYSLNNFYNSIYAFLSFSFLSSSMYIINDISDIEADKLHVTKKFRPLANGDVEIQLGIKISIFLFFLSIIVFYYFFGYDLEIYCLVFFYTFINLSYSFFLKKYYFISIILISLCYLIRIYIGSEAVNIKLNLFALTITLFFSLFILTCKRREKLFEKKNYFKLKFFDYLSYFFAAINIIFYMKYLFSASRFTKSFSLEISFIIFCILILRYLFLNHIKNLYDPIYIFFNDKVILIFSLIYFFNFLLGFYGLY